MPHFKTLRYGLLACFLSLSLGAQADAVNLSVGTNGAALEYYLMLSPRVNARFVLQDMPVDINRSEDDGTIKVNWDRTNLGMLFDFRPMAGSFHLTTGLYVGNHNINLAVKVKDGQDYDVGDKTYYGSNLGLKVKAQFAKAAPYFGLGWGTIPDNSGFSVNFDLGVLYLGKASINADATGEACATNPGDCTLNNTWFDVAGDPAFQQELQKQREQWQDDAKKLQFMPIIQLGFGYKF